MFTTKDQNTWSELKKDIDDSYRADKPDPRFPLVVKLMEGGSYKSFGKDITLDMVFEDVLNKYDPNLEIDETVLEYALEYPSSIWFERIYESAWGIVDQFEEG